MCLAPRARGSSLQPAALSHPRSTVHPLRAIRRCTGFVISQPAMHISKPRSGQEPRFLHEDGHFSAGAGTAHEAHVERLPARRAGRRRGGWFRTAASIRRRFCRRGTPCACVVHQHVETIMVTQDAGRERADAGGGGDVELAHVESRAWPPFTRQVTPSYCDGCTLRGDSPAVSSPRPLDGPVTTTCRPCVGCGRLAEGGRPPRGVRRATTRHGCAFPGVDRL